MNKPCASLVAAVTAGAAILLGSGASAGAAQGEPNLLTNGGFEQWSDAKPTGWAPYQNAATKRGYRVETKDTRSGKRAVRAEVVRGGGRFVGVVGRTLGLAKGEGGRVSVYVKGQPAKGATAYLGVLRYHQRAHKAVAEAKLPFTGKWQRLEVRFTKDWEGETLVYAGGSPRAIGTPILIDDCRLVSTGVVPPPLFIPKDKRRPGYRTHFRDGHLYVDGRPFFFVGFEYQAKFVTTQELVRRGINTLMAWPRAEAAWFVDAYRTAEKAGLMYIPYLAPASVYKNTRGWSEDKLREIVGALLPAPNLLLWQMSDDAHLDDIGYIAFGAGLIRGLDAGRRPIGADCHSGYPLYGQFLDAPRNYDYPLLKPNWSLRASKHWLRSNRNAWGQRDPLYYTITQPHAQGWYSRLVHPTPAWCRGVAVPGPAQTRSIHYGAIAAGARGFIPFSCKTFGDDLLGADRFAAYSLVATELSITGPYFAAGVPRADLATSNKSVEASPFLFQKGAIVVVQRHCPYDNLEFDANVAKDVTVDLPADAAPDAKVYEVGFPALRELTVKTVEGKRQFVLPRVDVATTVMVCADKALMQSVAQALATKRRVAAEFAIAAAREKHKKHAPVVEKLTAMGAGTDALRAGFARAAKAVATAQASYDAGKDAEAFVTARDAQTELRAAIRAYWDQVTDKGRLAETSIYLHDFYHLPRYHELAKRIAAGTWSANLLKDPSFESQRDRAEKVTESVHEGRDAADEAPATVGHQMQKAGRRFVTGAARTGQVNLVFESRVPLTYQGKTSDEWDWVKQQYVTESVPVEKGDIVEISAWVRVRADLAGTRRGALLAATCKGGGFIAGYHEANRSRRTDGWQQMRQIIYVHRDGISTASIRIAMCGRGVVQFDDLSVRKLVAR